MALETLSHEGGQLYMHARSRSGPSIDRSDCTCNVVRGKGPDSLAGCQTTLFEEEVVVVGEVD